MPFSTGCVILTETGFHGVEAGYHSCRAAASGRESIFGASTPPACGVGASRLAQGRMHFRLPTILIALLGLTGAARGDWLSDADARIEANRKANVTIRVVDAKGNAVNGATVALDQTQSAFRWGTAVNSDYYASSTQTADTAIYKSKIATLFNQAVLENGHKWTQWETTATRNRSNSTVTALLAQGKTLRGHTMVWQRPASMPGDVNAMIANNDAAGLIARTNAHIANIGGALAGKVSEWDVVNEQFGYHTITDVVNPAASIDQAPQLVDWFKKARAADANATLFINDWGILDSSGNSTTSSHQQSLFNTVQYLKSQGAPIGGIGFQSHVGDFSSRTTGPNLVTLLDRFATLGTKLEVTEFDITGDGWTEAAKATYMREFMTAAFANSSVSGFNVWGFWDGQHFADDAPLFNLDWSLKASGQAFMDLVFSQWRTDITGATNAAGEYATRGFLGDYAVDVTINGRTQHVTTTLDASGRTLTIVVPEPAALAVFGVAIVALRRRRNLSS